MKYFLIGMPGSGKSTLGKELASLLKVEYIDLDHFIEKIEGCPIPEIFKNKGQDYFRQRETEALKVIIDREKPAMVSTGGGAPCFNNNIDLINKGGVGIYIEVSTEELFKRVSSGVQNRPLFEGLSEKELFNKLDQMKAERSPFYHKAKYHIKGDRLTSLDILNYLKEKP